MSNAAIEVENLSKSYKIGSSRSYRTLRDTLSDTMKAPIRKLRHLLKGDASGINGLNETLWALHNISFRLEHGESLAIIGNNGAGKSTLLKILSRITSPSTGFAKINGRMGSLLEVGTGFHPELTGRENIYLNGSILGMTHREIQRKFDEIVDFAQVEKFLDTPVKHYSSGMYVRLAFSVAAHLEPEILVVDEVLAVGDVRFQRKCLGKMQDVAKSGRAVIFVSHNMPAVRSLCQKGLLIEKGEIKTQGSIEHVLHCYLSSLLETGGHKEWNAKERPGNGEIRLVSLSVLNDKKDRVDSINLSEECSIEITFEVIEEDAQANFALSVMTEEGACVFSSLNNKEPNFYGKALSKGLYTTYCSFYPHLFNNGRYYVVLVGFGAMGANSFNLDRAISFEAIDDGVLKGDYFGSYGGVIRPQLHWETQKGK